MKLSQDEWWESVLRVWKLDARKGNCLELGLRGSGEQEAAGGWGFCRSRPEHLGGEEEAKAYNLFNHHHLPSVDARGPGPSVPLPHHRRNKCFLGANLKASHGSCHFLRAGLWLVCCDILSVSPTELLLKDLLNEQVLLQITSKFQPLH